MIPIELKIKGLYSFKEEQVIDFTKLLESHLFGIFGKVGSGKSTILEAISFVLYGQSERLNARDNRGYNMMNLMSKEMNIEFIFKSGKKNTFYKAIAFAKKNRKGEVKKIERKLYRKEEGEWIPISVDEIPQIVGLSYDNFKRAIIIPQGKFQEFLGLKGTERSKMLKEIFNLDKFDLHHKAAILAARNKEKISHILGQLAQLEDVSAERLKAQETALKELEKTHQSSEAKLKKALAKLKKSESIKTLFEDLAKAESDYHVFIEKFETRFKELETDAKDIAFCNEHFKSGLEQLQQQEGDVSSLKKEIAQLNDELQVVDQQLVVDKKQFEALKEENEKRDYYQDVILSIEKGEKRLIFLNEKKSTDKRWERLKSEAKHFEQIVEGLEKEVKANKLQLEKLKKASPDLIELIKIRDWYEIDKDAKQSILEQEHELATIKKELDASAKRKIKIIQPIESFVPNLASLSSDEGLRILKKAISDFKESIKKITLHERTLTTKNALAEHAASLKDGESCPICGSLEHPNVLDGDDLFEQLHKVKEQLTDLQEKLELSHEVVSVLSALVGSESSLVARQEQVQARIAELEKKLATHQKTKFWKDKSIDSLDAILVKVQQAEQIIAKTEALSKQDKENEHALLDNEQKLKVLLPKIDAIEKQRNQLQSKVELLEDQILPKVFEGIKDNSLDELEAHRKKFAKTIIKNTNAFDSIEKKVKELEDQKTRLTTTLKVKNKSLQKEQGVFERINQKISAQVAKSKFSHLDEIIGLLAKNIDPRSQLDRVEKYKKEVFSKKQKWDELAQKTKKEKFDLDAFKKLKVDIEAQEGALKGIVGQLAKTQSLIQELTKRVAQKKGLKKDLKALELRAANIQTLMQLFKGQGFVNFISSVYLQNIVKAANHRFQNLTKHRLSLELKYDNSFMVRDQLNEGQTRNIKTLSGGQTFQAALCLALALADNIHELTKSEKNFFFLDEGFGSQDNESIAAVFKTLKALRKENRTVGIISHVDILQQEIDVHLTVELDQEKGSLIHQSW